MINRIMLGVLLGLALVSPARAQLDDRAPRAGSRIPLKIPTYDIEREEMRLVQARFGACVLKKHPAKARTFVLRYGYRYGEEPGARKIVKTLADGSCLLDSIGSDPGAAMMTLPGDMMAYLLAEALVRSELAALPPLSDLRRTPPLEHPVLEESDFAPPRRARKRELEELAERRAVQVDRIYLSKFGECIVRANPSDSLDLLNSPVVSPAEDAAFAALGKTLKSCLLDEYTRSWNKTALRGAVAYSYYRLAKASVVTPTTPGNQ